MMASRRELIQFGLAAAVPAAMLTACSDTDLGDSLEAVQARIDNAAKAGGGRVIIPAGTYVGQLVLRSNVTVVGDGRATRITIPENAELDVVQTSVSYDNTNQRPIVYTEPGCENAALIDVFIDGNGGRQNPKHHHTGLLIANARHIRISNVDIDNVNPDAEVDSFGLLTNASTDIRISGGRYTNCGYECVGIRDNTSDVKVIGITCASGGWHAFQAAFATRVSVIGCVFDQTDAPSTRFSTAAFHAVEQGTLADCVITGDRVVVLGGSRHVQITECQINSGPRPGVTVTGSSGVTVTNCSIIAGGPALELTDSHYQMPTHILFDGNTVESGGLVTGKAEGLEVGVNVTPQTPQSLPRTRPPETAPTASA